MLAGTDWGSIATACGAVIVGVLTYVTGRRRGRAELKVTDEKVDSIRLDRVLAALDGLGEEATRLRDACAVCEQARDLCDEERRTALEQVAMLRLRNAELVARVAAHEAREVARRSVDPGVTGNSGGADPEQEEP